MSAVDTLPTEATNTPASRSTLWLGNDDVRGIVGLTEGGEATITAEIHEASHGRVAADVQVVPVTDLTQLAEITKGHQNVDFAFLSVEPGLHEHLGPMPTAQLEAEAHAALLPAVINLADAGAHVFIITASTLTEPLAPKGASPRASLVLHARNLAAIEVAAATGASIIDLDRLVAEISGAAALTSTCRYTEKLNRNARAEIVRILEHYRLLDPDATPVQQVGTASSDAKADATADAAADATEGSGDDA